MSWLSAFADTIHGKRVKPIIPQSRNIFVSELEPDEPGEILEIDESASASVIISYVDAKGERSERPITINSIKGNGETSTLLNCYCHVRERPRSFRLDRIEDMCCEQSGEVLDPVEHCIALHRSGALKIADKDLTATMRIMTFIARCDDEFHVLENEQIEEILGRYLRFFGGDDVMFECAKREVTHLAPSDHHVLNSIEHIAKAKFGPELARFTMRAAGEVIDADGYHRDRELAWSVQLQDGLKQIAMRDR